MREREREGAIRLKEDKRFFFNIWETSHSPHLISFFFCVLAVVYSTLNSLTSVWLVQSLSYNLTASIYKEYTDLHTNISGTSGYVYIYYYTH